MLMEQLPEDRGSTLAWTKLCVEWRDCVGGQVYRRTEGAVAHWGVDTLHDLRRSPDPTYILWWGAGGSGSGSFSSSNSCEGDGELLMTSDQVVRRISGW